MKIVKFITTSEAETYNTGKKLGLNLKSGDIITLYGETGAGKTTFTRGVANSLGIDDETVSSPSYSLVNIYQGSLPVYHIDLYRLPSSDEIEASGIFTYPMDEVISIIEWPELARDFLPDKTISLNISYLPGLQRELVFELTEDRTNIFKDLL